MADKIITVTQNPADKIIKIIQNPTPNITISRNRDGKDFKFEDFTTEQLELIRGYQGEIGPVGPKGDKGDKGDHGYRDWETDRKSTRLNSSHSAKSRMPSSA